MKGLRKIFLTGLFVLIPLAATLSVIVWLFNLIDSIFRVPIEKILGFRIIGIGVIITVGVVLATGVIATHYLGERLINLTERVLSKIPLVSTIYISIKQLIETVFMKQRDAFKSAVVVPYPSKGIYTVGFITADAPYVVSREIGEEMKSIFIPTTPNPTSGMFVMIPVKDIIPLNIPVDVAVKMVVSGGILVPEEKKTPKQS